MEGRAVAGVFRPGMRGYFIPLAAGLVLAVSAFLPWVIVAGVPMRGVPDAPGVWVAALGAAAALLAGLSLYTRRNSRHPLLIVGLVALAILVLSWRILPQSAGDRALTISQAFAIVENTPMASAPETSVGAGIYVGLVAAAAIAAFGLTIVVRKASSAYTVTSPDDDV